MSLPWSPLTCLPKQTLTPSGLINLDTSDNEVPLLTRTSIELRSLSPTPLARPAVVVGGAASTNAAEKWSDRNADLCVTLTTHRIVFQSFLSHSNSSSGSSSSSSSNSIAHFLHHCAIKPQGISPTGGNWTASSRSYKIHIQSITHGDFYLIFRSGQKDRDAFLEQMQKALSRRQWEETYRMHSSQQRQSLLQPQLQSQLQSYGSTTGQVGVEAILQRNQYRHERAKKLTEDAFGNPNAKMNKKQHASKDKRAQEVEVLFREAGELISIIHKYVATLEKNQKEQEGVITAADNRSLEEDVDTTELTGMLQGMGMITALTRESAEEKLFHEMLARQICDFLLQNKAFKMSKGGSGIMTLTDVYCLYNRARGVNMISPEDLLEALGKMERLGLGMKVREFEGSGVKVLQEVGFDDSVMAKRLMDLMVQSEEEQYQSREKGDFGIISLSSFFGKGAGGAGAGGGGDGTDKNKRVYVGVTVVEASRMLHISPLLANEQLLSAERNGYLCRDVTLEGTRFYRNLFASSF